MKQSFSKLWILVSIRQWFLRDGKQMSWALKFPQLTALREFLTLGVKWEWEPRQNPLDFLIWGAWESSETVMARVCRTEYQRVEWHWDKTQRLQGSSSGRTDEDRHETQQPEIGKEPSKTIEGTVSSTRAVPEVPEVVTLPSSRTLKTHNPGDIGENTQETLAKVLGE